MYLLDDKFHNQYNYFNHPVNTQIEIQMSGLLTYISHFLINHFLFNPSSLSSPSTSCPFSQVILPIEVGTQILLLIYQNLLLIFFFPLIRFLSEAYIFISTPHQDINSHKENQVFFFFLLQIIWISLLKDKLQIPFIHIL